MLNVLLISLHYKDHAGLFMSLIEMVDIAISLLFYLINLSEFFSFMFPSPECLLLCPSWGEESHQKLPMLQWQVWLYCS